MSASEARGQDNGVQAHEGVGTPYHFTPALADQAFEALEFPQALERVAELAAGPLGADRIRQRLPSSDPSWVASELEPVRQLLPLLARGENLDVPPVPPLAAALGRLRIHGSVLSAQELLQLKQTIQAARVVAGELDRLVKEAPALSRFQAPVPARGLERRLVEAVDDEGELLDTASPALFAARREVHAARDRLIRKLETIMRGLDSAAVPTGGQVTLRGDRYVIPVRRDSRTRPDGIVHDESASQGTLFLEPNGAVEFGNALRAAITQAEREALKVLRDLTELCRPERSVIAAAHEMCVAVDDLGARARSAHRIGAEVPAIVGADDPLVLRSARHPLLLARGLEVVPFDLALDAEQRTLLISGPNAGGKTVLLKTVGVAALMVQSGLVPPVGPGSRVPVFDRIFADIGDHQSLAADLSTFSAHLTVMKRVLAEADRDSLVLVDEIGSGTDPAEGAALAGSVLVTLTARGVRTVATTHLGALKVLAAELPGVVNGSLQFDVETLTPTFRFQQGVPGRSYGLAMAKRLGIDAAVIARAEAELPVRERALDEMLAQVETRDQALRGAAEALEHRTIEVESREANVEAREALTAAREREVSRREREAERAARKEAREHLLRARTQVEEALRLARGAVDLGAAKEARKVLEEAAKDEAAALEAPSLEETAEMAGGELVVGGRVKLPNGSKGTLMELRPDGKAVVASGAVKLVLSPRSLVSLPGAAAKSERATVSTGADSVSTAAAPMEIDLRGLRADEAETATLAALDAAVLADNPYLRIIHGMGTGVLRDRVQRLLRSDRRVSRFDFAPRNQGGTGVTVVEFGASA